MSGYLRASISKLQVELAQLTGHIQTEQILMEYKGLYFWLNREDLAQLLFPIPE